MLLSEQKILLPHEPELIKPVYHLYTIQLAQWRLAKEKEIHLLNIAVKGGILPFAPDWSMVRAYKNREIKKKAYAERYERLMAESQKKHPKYWDALLRRPVVAYACYCSPNVFCHRHLFKVIAENYIKSRGFQVIQCGELVPEKTKEELDAEASNMETESD
jgi:hypothetical protein